MKLKAEVKDSENVIKETSIQSIRDLEIFIKSKGKDKQPLDICIRHVREEDKTLTEWVKTKVFSSIGISSKDPYRYYGIVMPKTLDMETLTKRIAKEKNIVSQSKVNDKATLTESIRNVFRMVGERKGNSHQINGKRESSVY